MKTLILSAILLSSTVFANEIKINDCDSKTQEQFKSLVQTIKSVRGDMLAELVATGIKEKSAHNGSDNKQVYCYNIEFFSTLVKDQI